MQKKPKKTITVSQRWFFIGHVIDLLIGILIGVIIYGKTFFKPENCSREHFRCPVTDTISVTRYDTVIMPAHAPSEDTVTIYR